MVLHLRLVIGVDDVVLGVVDDDVLGVEDEERNPNLIKLLGVDGALLVGVGDCD